MNKSILQQIKDARTEAREEVRANPWRDYPIVKSDGWAIITTTRADRDRHAEYFEGPVTMRVIRDAIESAIREHGDEAVVWIEGRYDYATHINTSAEDYDYEVGEYWTVNLLNSFE